MCSFRLYFGISITKIKYPPNFLREKVKFSKKKKKSCLKKSIKYLIIRIENKNKYKILSRPALIFQYQLSRYDAEAKVICENVVSEVYSHTYNHNNSTKSNL